MPPTPRIAILGGGISGLAAAERLTSLLPTADVHLYEAADRLGGVLQTVQRAGFLIELAADNFLVKPCEGFELCQRVGLGAALLTTDDSRRQAFVVRGGELIPVPAGFFLMSPRKLLPMLMTPAIGLAGKLRLMAEPFIPRATGNTGQGGYDESVASFTRRRLGREVSDKLVQPLVSGIYTADPERLSMAATMPQFLEFERDSGSLLRATLFGNTARSTPNRTAGTAQSPPANPHININNATSGARYGMFIAPKDGMASLVQAAASVLPTDRIHLKSPVASITSDDGTWRLQFADSTAGDVPSDFSAVIVALPAHHAATALENVDAELASELSAIEYAGCAIVCLGFAREQFGHPLDGFGFVVPHTERRRIIAGSFASVKFPGRAPEHHVLVRVFLGGALQPDMLKLADDELVRVARDELTELLRMTGTPMMQHVVRWPQTMPQYHVGHLARVARIEQFAANHPGLALAGNAYRGVGIPQCIASGQAAAERLATHFAHA